MGRLGTGPRIQARSSSHGNQDLLYSIGEKDVWGVKLRHLLGWKGGQVLIAGVVLLALYNTGLIGNRLGDDLCDELIAKGITADVTASNMNGKTMLEHNENTSDNTAHASLHRYREDRQIIAGPLVRKSNSKTKPKSNTNASSRSGLTNTEVDTDKTNEHPKARGIVMSCPLGVPSESAGSWKPVNMFRGVEVVAERLYELESSLPLVVVSFNSELPAHHACLKLKDKHADINSQIYNGNGTNITCLHVLEDLKEGYGTPKIAAIEQTTLEEVMWLDCDTYLIKSPDFLFEDRDYRAAGSMFWPDIEGAINFHPTDELFKQHSVDPAHFPHDDWRMRHGFDSGVLLIDKDRTQFARVQLALMSTEPLYSFWGTYSLGDKDLWHLAWIFTRTPFAYNPIASVCGSFNSDGRWHMTSQLKYDSDGVSAFLVHQVWRDHTHRALYASASRRQRRDERGSEAKKKKNKKNREDTQTLENDGQGHAENGDINGWKDESAADGGGYNGDEDAIGKVGMGIKARAYGDSNGDGKGEADVDAIEIADTRKLKARDVDVDGSIEDRGAAGVDVGSGVGIRVDADPLQYPLEDPVANVLGSGKDGTIDYIEGNADSIDKKESLVSDFEQMYNAPTVTIRYDLRERQRAGKPVDYKVNDKRFYNEFNTNRLAGLKEDRNGNEAVFADNEISITTVEVVQAIEHAYRGWWLGSEDINMGDNGEIEGSLNKQGGRSDTMSEF